MSNTAQQIADDVARRYGVPVSSRAVQIVPQGVTALRFDDIPLQRAANASKRRYASRPKKPDVPMIEGEDAMAYINRARAAGASLESIGKALNVQPAAVWKRIRRARADG